jgi:hypothetical protein
MWVSTNSRCNRKLLARENMPPTAICCFVISLRVTVAADRMPMVSKKFCDSTLQAGPCGLIRALFAAHTCDSPMDNRPDPSEDEQTTPEHACGRKGPGGYTRAQPDRSGAETSGATDGRAGGSHTSGWPPPHPFEPQLGEQHLAQLLAPLVSALGSTGRALLRRCPVQVAIGTFGVMMIVTSALTHRRRAPMAR